MDELRIILLLTGAACIAGIYFWSRLQQRPARRKGKRTAAHAANADTDEADIARELAHMEQLLAERDDDPDWNTAPVESGEQLLVIAVVAEDGVPFLGDKLLKAFANNNLVHSSKGVYERQLAGSDAPTVFSVANLVKPGTFPRDMPAFTSPGLTLFLQLPCAIGVLDAFDDFMNTAERLAVELAGEMRDENHQLLTHQALMQVRERLAEAQLRSHAAAS